MNTLEILTAARAKIADEKNWCQGEYARDVDGVSTGANNSEACSWCSFGSIASIVGGFKGVYTSSEFLEKFMGDDIAKYNDSHTHSEVLAAWDWAIAECAKETQ